MQAQGTSRKSGRMLRMSVLAAVGAVGAWAFDAAATRSCYIAINVDCCSIATPQAPESARCCTVGDNGKCLVPCPDFISTTSMVRNVEIVTPGSPGAWTGLIEIKGQQPCKWIPFRCTEIGCVSVGPTTLSGCTEHIVNGEKCQ